MAKSNFTELDGAAWNDLDAILRTHKRMSAVLNERTTRAAPMALKTLRQLVDVMTGQMAGLQAHLGKLLRAAARAKTEDDIRTAAECANVRRDLRNVTAAHWCAELALIEGDLGGSPGTVLGALRLLVDVMDDKLNDLENSFEDLTCALPISAESLAECSACFGGAAPLPTLQKADQARGDAA